MEDKLFNKKEIGWSKIDTREKEAIYSYCNGYMNFMNKSKTEREAVITAKAIAESNGFRDLASYETLNPGDKVYFINREKSMYLAVIGTEKLENGIQIVGAHIDSPRLDLKPNPLYEDSGFAYFKTHYYGGIKKYQWVTVPLELRGVVALKNGKKVKVAVGAKENDPLLVITDLLPHLANDQYKKSLAESFTGEGLNILIGSRPFEGDKVSDGVKLEVMRLINEEYGIEEEDFLSAELSAVPAYKACDIGFDRSMIGGYGHDDRVCAYAALRSVLEVNMPRYTSVCVLADKEEIGSEGVTGMKSKAFDMFATMLCEADGSKLDECFANSICLSTDVCNGFDPNYPEVSEKRNSAKLNYGVGICKYTGSRGKSGASDASAELVAQIRELFDEGEVFWQMAELGKVDQGGGGTVAMFMAERNINTIDAGVPVLSMHAPFEVVSKLDCYMTYKGIKTLFKR